MVCVARSSESSGARSLTPNLRFPLPRALETVHTVLVVGECLADTLDRVLRSSSVQDAGRVKEGSGRKAYHHHRSVLHNLLLERLARDDDEPCLLVARARDLDAGFAVLGAENGRVEGLDCAPSNGDSSFERVDLPADQRRFATRQGGGEER